MIDEERPMNNTFYMVWCEGNQAPRIAHPDYSTARAEAVRLAKANPEKAFTILEAKETVVGKVKVEGERRRIPYQPSIHGELS